MNNASSRKGPRGKKPVVPADALPNYMRNHAAWLLALALVLAVVSYWPALQYAFTFDDIQQIVRNPALRSWSYLPQYFTANVWAGVFPHGNGNYYRPLFLLWLRLNYILFGLAPWGWHLTSLVAHLAVTAVFFLLARQWTGDEVVAGWAAVLFAVHPIHIESVVWVSAAPEVLFSLAGLGAIVCYLRFRQGQRGILLPVAVSLYGVALFAKETAIVIWPVIAACDWWLGRGSELNGRPEVTRPRLMAFVKMNVPFAAVTAIYFAMRIYALRALAGGAATHTVTGILFAAPGLLFFYLRKLVVPSGLSPIYFDPENASFASPQFYLALVVVCAVGAGLFVWARKSRAAALPALLLGLSLVPPLLGVSVFPRHDLAHNRYLYLASASACMLFALAWRAATKIMKPIAGSAAAWVGTLLVSAVALAMVFGIRAQEQPYRDNVALFSRAVEIAPESTMAWGFLGEELMTRERNAEGIASFQHAQALEPDSFLNNYRLGAAYYVVQDMPSAEDFFQRSAASYGEREIVSYDFTLYRLGLAQYAQAKMAQAELTLRRAVEIRPTAPGYHLALGAAMQHEGKLAEAKEQLELELKIAPDPEASQVLNEVNAALSATSAR